MIDHYAIRRFLDRVVEMGITKLGLFAVKARNLEQRGFVVKLAGG